MLDLVAWAVPRQIRSITGLLLTIHRALQRNFARIKKRTASQSCVAVRSGEPPGDSGKARCAMDGQTTCFVTLLFAGSVAVRRSRATPMRERLRRCRFDEAAQVSACIAFSIHHGFAFPAFVCRTAIDLDPALTISVFKDFGGLRHTRRDSGTVVANETRRDHESPYRSHAA